MKENSAMAPNEAGTLLQMALIIFYRRMGTVKRADNPFERARFNFAPGNEVLRAWLKSFDCEASAAALHGLGEEASCLKGPLSRAEEP